MQTAKKSKQCSNYIEFIALFSFKMLSQLVAHLKLKNKTKHWISSRSWKI